MFRPSSKLRGRPALLQSRQMAWRRSGPLLTRMPLQLDRGVASLDCATQVGRQAVARRSSVYMNQKRPLSDFNRAYK